VTFERYAQWLSRGRTHQAAGRAIDALLCYRRALRESPQGVEAQFHAGEIAWHMGHRAEAIAAWRSASAASPRHLPSWHALADALAANGEIDASRDAVTRVLELRPDEPRAGKLRLLLDAAIGAPAERSLAHALSRVAWPLPLLAAVVERCLERGDDDETLSALLDASLRVPVTRDDVDALRRIALAVTAAGRAEAARNFADRYADACRALVRPTVPLLWPMRTAGRAIRVGVIAAERGDLDALRAALDAAGLRERVDCTPLGDAETTAAFFTSDALAALPDAAARAAAALDLDVLIDLAGLALASGPLLALHPARTVWMIERPATPFARRLADRTFDAAEGCASALRGLHVALSSTASSATTAAELAASWQRAVRAHQAGELGAARAEYERVLAEQPAHAPALYLLGALARS
jgi:tetratricopeptide (TPR) repeat protein